MLNIKLFFFFFTILLGVSYHIIDVTPKSDVPDTRDYIGIAHLDFDQHPVRKYRVIVPLAAFTVNAAFGNLFEKVRPWSFPDDEFGLSVSFLLVNVSLMALFFTLLYHFVLSYSSSPVSIVIALASALATRWTLLIAAMPIVDSLYLVVIMLILLGIKKNKNHLIYISLFLGPWAKESFVFFIPIIFFFSSAPKKRVLLLIFLSGVQVVFGRYLIDSLSGGNFVSGISEDIAHFSNFAESFYRLISFRGFFEVFSVVSLWPLLLIPLIANKQLISFIKKIDVYLFWFFLVVFVHAILSTDLARMFYLASPALAAVWSCAVDWWPNRMRAN